MMNDSIFQALATLGFKEGSVTLQDIKKAYRTKAKLMHPDKGGDELKFKELVAAYELLTGKRRIRQLVLPQPVTVQQQVWVEVGRWVDISCHNIYSNGTTSAATSGGF